MLFRSLSTQSAGSTANATFVSGQEIAADVAGNRGSWINDTPSGESEPQSHLAMLSSIFGAFDEQQADAVGSNNFGADFLTEQQDFASCG